MTILERVKGDVTVAMKEGDRDRAAALRMVANALDAEHREGKGDEIAILRRERKKRLEAAEAFRDGGAEDRASAEEREAELIGGYLPAELGDEELERIVREVIAETGASGPGDMGQVMGAAMPKVGGRADGKRVSAAVRRHLGS